MSAGKELKFSFVLDEASFQRVKRAIQDLTSEMQKFAKAMSPAQGGAIGSIFGGANVGRPGSAAATVTQGAGKGGGVGPIGQVVSANADAFKSLASAGTTSLKGLTDALKRSVNEQLREVRGLQQALDRLGATYNNLGGKGTTAMAVQNKMVQVAGRLSASRGQLSSLQGMLGPQPELMPEVPYPEQPGPGMGQRFKNFMYQPPTTAGGRAGFFGGAIQGIGPTSAAGIAGMVGMVAGGIMAAIREAQSGARMYGSAETNRWNLVKDDIRAMRGGDISSMVARQMLRTDTERRRDLASETGALGTAGAYVGGIFQAGSNLVSRKGGGIAGALADPQATMFEATQDQVNNYKNSAAFAATQFGLERFNEGFGSRISAGRVLGLGLQSDYTTPAGVRMPARDTYLRRQAALHARGYSIEQQAAAVQQSRQLGMGGGYADEIMGAGAMGWGQWGDIRANAARGGNADLALAALGTTRNTAAGMQIGQMAFGFDPRGTTSGIGLMQAIQGGGFNFTGGVGDMNIAARIQAGMGAGDMMARGFDPYQQGRNLISSIGLGGGLGTYGQDYLGNGMSFKQLMDAASGDISKTGQALGVTSGMARGQLQNMAGSVFERYQDQGENTPMARAIRAFRKSGKGLSEFLQTADTGTRDAMGAFLGMETGQGEEAGMGAIGILAGVGNKKLKNGKVPYGAVGETEQARLDAEAKQMLKDAEAIEAVQGQIKTSYDKMDDAIKSQTDWAGNLSESAQTVTDALDNLADAINDRATSIRTGQPVAPRTSATTKAQAPTLPESPSAPTPSGGKRGSI